MDPFGIEELAKRDKRRAEHYGRMGGAMTTLGVTAGGVGAGAGLVGRLERKGKDPMGFTAREHPGQRALSEAAKMRVLKPMSAAHAYQAKTLGGIGAGALTLGAAYKHKKKRELAKRERRNWKRSASDTGLAAGSVAVGGAALKHGGKNAHMLNSQAQVYGEEARGSHHLLQSDKHGLVELDPTEKKFHLSRRSTGVRVASVKRPAALAAAGAAAAGGAGIYELGRYGAGKLKRKKS